MRPPQSTSPFVVLGSDGKEYPAGSREELGQWLGQGAINEATRIWSEADQKWATAKELAVRRLRRVTVTTGDMNRDYQVIDVVFAFIGKDTPAFGRVDVPAGFNEVTNQLATAAAALGANAVIWARYSHEWGGTLGGIGFFASGTAVEFTQKA